MSDPDAATTQSWRTWGAHVQMDECRRFLAYILANNPDVQAGYMHDKRIGLRPDARSASFKYAAPVAFRGKSGDEAGRGPTERAEAALRDAVKENFRADNPGGACLLLAHDLIWWNSEDRRYEPVGQEGRFKFYMLISPFKLLDSIGEINNEARLKRMLHTLASVRSVKRRAPGTEPDGNTEVTGQTLAGSGGSRPTFTSLYKRHVEGVPLVSFCLDIDGKCLARDPVDWLPTKHKITSAYMPLIKRALRIAMENAGIDDGNVAIGVHGSTGSKPSFRVYAIGLDFASPADGKAFFQTFFEPQVEQYEWCAPGLFDAALYRTCWCAQSKCFFV